MALTALVQDELSRLQVTKPCCRRAETPALIRFAGETLVADGRAVVEVRVEATSTAKRFRRSIAELFGASSDVHAAPSGGAHRGARYVVRVEVTTLMPRGLARRVPG